MILHVVLSNIIIDVHSFQINKEHLLGVDCFVAFILIVDIETSLGRRQ